MNAAEEEARSARLRSRLWGAIVLIAVLVIVLPLLLDGSGSESRFRRIERLREEPPRVLGIDGRPEVASNSRVVVPPEREPAGSDGPDGPDVREAPEAAAVSRIHIGEDDPPDYLRTPPSERAELARKRTAAMSAWVVQAGSFAAEANALAVRDTLRKAGFASFVTAHESDKALFRVRVGPMIDERVARDTRRAVAALTGLDAALVTYP